MAPWNTSAGAARGRLRALLRTAIFVLEMAPGLPARAIDRVTHRPIVERLAIPGPDGPVDADLYRPPGRGRRPGVILSLGVLPQGVDDPRAAMLAHAFARAGFVALVYWSPATRDLRLDAADVPWLVAAYRTVARQPFVDPARTGFMGVCVGASLAMLAAADPAIRDRVAFIAVHAPYASLRSLAVDIASESRPGREGREPWPVDPLTWQVWVRSTTAWLRPAEAARLREAFERRIAWNPGRTEVIRSPVRPIDPDELSPDARAVQALLAAGPLTIGDALHALPPAAAGLLTALSPIARIAEVVAPLIVLIHDREDHVIPVDESRQLWAAIGGRSGTHYTELGLRHLRIPRGWSPVRIAREMVRAAGACYPLFEATFRPRERPRRDRRVADRIDHPGDHPPGNGAGRHRGRHPRLPGCPLRRAALRTGPAATAPAA